jgi:hypothetical protein
MDQSTSQPSTSAKSTAAKATWQRRNAEERRRILGPANLNTVVAGLVRRRNRAIDVMIGASVELDRIQSGPDPQGATVVAKQIERLGLLTIPVDLPFLRGVE